MVIYVVRHGRTKWNERGIMQGLTDIDLDDVGIKQAYLAKEELIGVNFDVCFSSPLRRASKTAEIIVDNRCKIIYDDLLIERSMGTFEKKPYNLYKNSPYWDYNLNLSDNGVESIKHLFSRASEFLNKIKKQYNDKTVLVVSHGALIRALHYLIMGYDSKTDFLSFNVSNAKVYRYEI